MFPYLHVGVVLVLGCHSYHNNSIVTLADIASNTTALVCYTDKVDCCRREKTGEWYYPNGSQVRINSTGDGFYRDRGPSAVRLHRRNHYDTVY